MFLGGHPQIASLGELNFLGKAVKLGELCSCGSTVSACQAWEKIYREIQRETGIYFPDTPYSYKLWDARSRVIIDHDYQNKLFHARFLFRRAWMGVRALLPSPFDRIVPIPPAYHSAIKNKMRIFRIISKIWGKRVVVDSSKNPWEAVELARRFPGQVKVLLVTRDGRGVYLSRRGSGFGREASVLEWSKYYQNAAPMLREKINSENLMQLRYEDFASDPESMGRKICGFIGLDYDPAMLDFSSGERHMANGNDTRFKSNKGIRLDERWRSELVGEELAYFERHGGSVNHMLGYV
jgi:hypothetical protein